MFILYVLIIFVLLIISGVIGSQISRHAPTSSRHYKYMRRDYIMTETEAKLFRRLERIVEDKYYVFPQVHLSSLLKNGQPWKGSLSAIQRKSVDFALVDKSTLQTTYAVELDDSTHDRPDRQERDGKVEEYMRGAGMPLVRLRNIDKMSDEDIISSLREAHAQNEAA